jgi:hypothetical protein
MHAIHELFRLGAIFREADVSKYRQNKHNIPRWQDGTRVAPILWKRGSDEYINSLLRQYFPIGTDLPNIYQNRLNAVARLLNKRPKMSLAYYFPASSLEEAV